MAVGTSLVTIAQFRMLPEDSGPVYHELRHGEVVTVTRPKLGHFLIQSRLVALLTPVTQESGLVATEVAFRALAEYELRVADVAFLRGDRVAGTSPDDNVQGAPELVIEVLSPSNTASEIYDKETLCLENGALEFWVVDPDRRQVRVSTLDRRTVTYRAGEEIPMPMFGDARLSVDGIFG